MTVRKKARTDDETERVDDGSTGEKDATMDDFDRAKLAFGKSQDLIRVKFAIVSPDGGEKHLETLEYEPEIHTEDFIRLRYGAGRYRLRFIGPDWKYRMMFTADLAPLPSDSKSAEGSRSPLGFDPLTYFMRESEQARQQFNQVVLALIGKGGAGGGGGSEIAKVLEVMGNQNTKLMELAIAQRSAPAPGANLSDAVLKALEIGMEAVSNAKADSEGGWVSQFARVARELAPLLLAQQAAAPGSPPALPASTIPVAPVVAPENVLAFPSSVASANDLRSVLLKQYSPAAVDAARNGQSPMDFAGMILDSVGVSYHPMFDSLTSNDLVSLQPELGQIRWIDPETKRDEGLWVDLVMEMLRRRDFGEEDVEGGEPV